MDYAGLLSRAWKITWNNKILWIFGFLAGLGSSTSNFSPRTGGPSGGPSGSSDFPGSQFLPPELSRQFDENILIAIVLAFVCIALIVGLVFFILSVIGRGGLIGGIRTAEDNEKVSFGEAWGYGVRYFWRMLGIQLIILLASLLIASFGAISAIIGGLTFGIGLICLIPILCVLVLSLIPLSILSHFAQFGVVVEDLGVMEAYRRAWQVLKDNFAPLLLVAIILFLIGGVAGLLLVTPFVAVVIPTIAAFAINPEDPNVALLAISGLALLCYLPIAIVLGSILQTWTTSVWTLAYRQVTGNTPAAPANLPPMIPPSEPEPPSPSDATIVAR